MYKGRKKVISLVMTALMVTSTAFTAQTRALAASGAKFNPQLTIDKQAELAKAKTLFQNAQTKLSSDKSKVTVNTENKDTVSTNLNPEDDVRLIVQLEGKAVTDYLHGVQIAKTGFDSSLQTKVLNSQSALKAQVLKLDKNIKIKDTYSILLNGFSVQAKAKDIAKIQELPGVKHVTIARQFYPDMNYAKDITHVTDVWNNLGIKGEGQVVAIIDTGIDMNHKDMKITDTSKEKLKPAAGFNDKVPYGYNFADDNQDIKAAPGTSEHGMHVSGIVAANGDPTQVAQNLAVQGVAPEAQLLAMKVFSNNPAFASAFSDDIVAAIEASVAHKADVLNMSLGSSCAFQDPESAEQIAVNEANANGTVCVISAGNDQYSLAPYKFGSVVDDGVVGAPGLSKDSLCVASYENTNITSYGLDYTTSDGQSSSAPMLYTVSGVNPLDALTNTKGYDAIYAGIGQPSDFAGKDFTGKIALVQRGTLDFVTKQENAQAAGAIGIVVFDNKPNEALINMATDPSVTIPALFISNADGVKLQGLLANGLKIFFKGNVATVANPAAGNMSDFTSWGPTPELDIKPEVSAPGGNIWSTVNNNRYESMSGTSMASPHTAGIAALVSENLAKIIKTNTPVEKADLVKEMIINTAVPQLDPATKGVNYFSPRRQGAGLVNAAAATKNYVTITNNAADPQAVFALKEIDTTTDKFTLYFHNYSAADITYTAKDLSGVMTEQSKSTASMSYDVPLDGASIAFDKSEVTVKAGGDAQVNVTLTLPAEVTDSFVEGYLSFTDKAGKAPTIGTTYMGFYGEWDALQIADQPEWDSDNTLLGYTGLYTEFDGQYYDLASAGYDADGYPVYNSDKIAISPYGNSNIIPVVTYLRNAKSGSIQILDSDKNVITTVAQLTDITKDELTEATPAKLLGTDASKPYAWDGTVWNAAVKDYMPVPDGQYYVRVNNVIDYPNAKVQSVDMPVKVDTISPDVEDATYADNKVSFAATDDFSGFDSIAYFVDGDLNNPQFLSVYDDGNGNKLGYDSTTGKYSFPLSLSSDRQHEIDIIGFDSAGNSSYDYVMTDSKIVISSPVDGSTVSSGDFTVNFTLPADELTNGNTAYIGLDPMALTDLTPLDNSATSYSFNNVAPGQHAVLIAIFDSTQTNLIDENYISITVPAVSASKMSINIDPSSIQPGGIYGSYVFVTGTLSEKPTKFEIAGIDATGEEYLNPDTLQFAVPVELTEGLNKISFYAQGSTADDYQRYSINVYGDTEAPVLTFTSPSVDFGPVTIINTTNTTYEFKGSVQDDLFGYNFYLNNEALKTISLEVPDKSKTLYNFDITKQLTFGMNVFTFKAVDQAGNVTLKTMIVNCNAPDRLSGSTRVDTAIKISQKGWNTSDYAVLVNGSDTATTDGLVAAPLANSFGAPVLFTMANSKNPTLEKSVQNELSRLQVKQVFIIGGESAVPKAVYTALSKYAPVRINGSNRYDTSVKVAEYMLDNELTTGTSMVLVNGYAYADALSAAPYAAAQGSPILLTSNNSLPDAVANYIDEAGVEDTWVVGGTAVISDDVMNSVPNAHRTAGANRYETNAKVLAEVNPDFTTTYMASGVTFADAIAVAALAAKDNAAFVLVNPAAPDASTRMLMKNTSYEIQDLCVIGGKTVISDEVVSQLLN